MQAIDPIRNRTKPIQKVSIPAFIRLVAIL